MLEELLRLENVSSEEHGNLLFHNLNLSIFKNTKIGIANILENECSALAKLLSGLSGFSQGQIIFHGKKYEKENYASYAQHSLLKISHISKKAQLVPTMSITENLFSIRRHAFTSLFNKHAATIRTQQILKQYQISLNPDTKISHLSYSQQHLIQIIKAVDTGAEIIILDNIALSYTPTEKELLFGILSKINHCGIIYMSSSIDPFFHSMDQVIAMKKGRIIRPIFSSDYSNELLTSLLIGHNSASPLIPPEKTTLPDQDTILEISYLAGNSHYKIELKRHEILGIIDLNGSLYHAMNQLEFYPGNYSLTISGKKITSYQQAAKHGCYFLTENHIQSGLFNSLSFKENLTILCASKTTHFGIIVDHLDEHLASTYEAFFKKEELPLSKWGAIKFILFRYLAIRPKIVVLGINSTDILPSAQEEFYEIIRLYRKHGIALLMVHVDYTDQTSLCQRLITIQNSQTLL